MDILQIDNLSFRYPGAQSKALDGISFRVRAGEFVVICGESGCEMCIRDSTIPAKRPRKGDIPR